MGAVLRFPAQKKELIEKEAAPVIEKLDLQNARTLHETVKHVLEGAQVMIEYVDSNRQSARKMGVESIAVELSSMVDSGKLGSVKDALHEALAGSKPAYITREGFSYLQRAEKLLSEGIKAFAANGRAMFSGSPSMGGGCLNRRRPLWPTHIPPSSSSGSSASSASRSQPSAIHAHRKTR